MGNFIGNIALLIIILLFRHLFVCVKSNMSARESWKRHSNRKYSIGYGYVKKRINNNTNAFKSLSALPACLFSPRSAAGLLFLSHHGQAFNAAGYVIVISVCTVDENGTRHIARGGSPGSSTDLLHHTVAVSDGPSSADTRRRKWTFLVFFRLLRWGRGRRPRRIRWFHK